ncbi:hypothetical protein [Vibrio casei]|uniref:hypothetical protein n=1 Tax=Vibrio casei TaxID=673372 RepID=UPI00097EEC27|nr:hypothetical protein FM109_02975 [Vibrio casei]
MTPVFPAKIPKKSAIDPKTDSAIAILYFLFDIFTAVDESTDYLCLLITSIQ